MSSVGACVVWTHCILFHLMAEFTLITDAETIQYNHVILVYD